MDLTPALLLGMWSAGLAAGGAVVGWWKIVGPGYLWVTAAVVTAFGVPAAAAGGGLPGWIAVGCGIAAGLQARRPAAAVGLLSAAAALFAVGSLDDSPAVAIATGALFLGGVTSEMMLGHWFLVDPTLPRWSLRALTLAGGVGLVLDAVYLIGQGVLDWVPEDAVLGWAWIVLAAFTGLLVLGVWFSLKESSYTGVMAATGLSYLATLTAFGAVVVGRMILTA